MNKEAFQIVCELNDSVYTQFNIDNLNLFEFRSNGLCDSILFSDIILWSSDEEIDYELDGITEVELKSYVIDKFKNLQTMISDIKL